MKRYRQFFITCQFLNCTAVIRLTSCFLNQLSQFIGFRLITSLVNEPRNGERVSPHAEQLTRQNGILNSPRPVRIRCSKVPLKTKITVIVIFQGIQPAMKKSMDQDFLEPSVKSSSAVRRRPCVYTHLPVLL